MDLDLDKERQDFAQFQAWTLNHTSCGPSPTFQGWMESKITLARYNEMKTKADPACQNCHGRGYLPVFLPGDTIASPCPCVESTPRSTQALAMMREANKPELHPLPVRFVRAQTRWGRLINWITQEIP